MPSYIDEHKSSGNPTARSSVDADLLRLASDVRPSVAIVVAMLCVGDVT
jgi:hypothetical protein